MDFNVELYDPSSPDGKMSRLYGNDTATKITILDEDFPGTLKFEDTQISVVQGKTHVNLKILREAGSDGIIHCFVKSGPETTNTNAGIRNAVEYEDYVPVYEKVTFGHGEVEKIVKIDLVTIKPIKESELENGKSVDDVIAPKEDAD